MNTNNLNPASLNGFSPAGKALIEAAYKSIVLDLRPFCSLVDLVLRLPLVNERVNDDLKSRLHPHVVGLTSSFEDTVEQLGQYLSARRENLLGSEFEIALVYLYCAFQLNLAEDIQARSGKIRTPHPFIWATTGLQGRKIDPLDALRYASFVRWRQTEQLLRTYHLLDEHQCPVTFSPNTQTVLQQREFVTTESTYTTLITTRAMLGRLMMVASVPQNKEEMNVEMAFTRLHQVYQGETTAMITALEGYIQRTAHCPTHQTCFSLMLLKVAYDREKKISANLSTWSREEEVLYGNFAATFESKILDITDISLLCLAPLADREMTEEVLAEAGLLNFAA